jgi:hypothetical protein
MEKKDEISIPEKIILVSNSIQEQTVEKTREQLVALINELINKDFHTLIQLLYRIDVDEKKIRHYLDENTNADSATILAGLVIERQLQKIKSRKLFSGENNESNEEKW